MSTGSKHMKRPIYLLLIVLELFYLSCDSPQGNHYIFPADNDISDSNGNPADSTVYFFPRELIFKDTSILINQGFWYTPNLHVAKERILYNYYLDHDIYRFSWFRSFQGPVFISIHRGLDNYWLTLKKLNKPYVKYQEVIKFIPPKGESDEDVKTVLEENRQMMDSLKVLPKIESEKTIRISKKEWDEFEQLLEECDYWGLQPSDPRQTGLDGSHWIIEAHFANKYWLVNRWSPSEKFRDCGEYLLRLGGFKGEVY